MESGCGLFSTFKRLTFRRGNIGVARFAPDGKSIVYGASWEGEPLQIFTARPEGPESTPLGFKNADLFGISASSELALSVRDRFLTGGAGAGTLARAPLGGGVPREVLEFVEYADWAPSGKDLAICRFLEGKVRLEYPIGKVLYSSSRNLYGPRFSPRGDRIAFFERGTKLMVTDLTGQVRTLAGPGLRSVRLAWSPSGDEIWFDDLTGSGEGQIRGVTLSGKTRVLLRGPDHFFMHDVARDGKALVERAASRRSVVCLPPGETKERDLSWFDGSEPIAISPDGKTVLFAEAGDAGGKTRAFYLRKTDGSPAVKLGEGEAHDLSPDGKWVLVRSEDAKSLTLVPTGTGGSVAVPSPGFERIGGAKFFPDGRRLLLAASEPGKRRRFFVQDLPSGKPRALSGEGFDTTGNPVSADGRWVVAYRDWEEDLSLFPTDGGSPHNIPDSKRLDPVGWSSDGKSVFAVETGSIPARVVRVDVASGRRALWRELGPPDRSGLVSINYVSMTPDEKSYVYGYSRAVTSDLYLVDGLK